MKLREVRSKIYEDVKAELLGPGSEDTGVDIVEEIITDRPSSRYVTGILFANEEDLKLDKEQNKLDEREIEIEEKIEEFKYKFTEMEVENHYKREIADNEDYYEEMNNAHIKKKRTMGLTIFINNNVQKLKVNIRGARYKKTLLSQCMVKYRGDLLPLEERSIGAYIYSEDGFLKLKMALEYKIIKEWESEGYFDGRSDFGKAVYKLYDQCKSSYKRKEIVFKNPIVIEFNGRNKESVKIEDEELKVFALKRKYKSGFSITVMLINEAIGKKDEKFLFQPEIRIYSEENNFIFIPSTALNTSLNPKLDLLYRNKKSYAIGHGVSVDYININPKTGQGYVKTDYLPTYEVANSNFDVDIDLDYDILAMKNLSILSNIDKDRIICGLERVVNGYERWINDIRNEGRLLKEDYTKAIKENIKNCSIAKDRMYEGIRVLKSNPNAFLAFQLANTAMLIQRLQSIYKKSIDVYEGIDIYSEYNLNDARWRAFQLAFLLMNVSAIVDKNSKYRDIVDLIWIPTGGGKTEAYLGVSAFTIFNRRLTRGKSGYGTTIIMRYTLRLLAAQQFERAAKLICACEYIRRETDYKLGNEPISIGLWIGNDQTPNTIADAHKCKQEMMEEKYSENKFQLLKCPWCGEELVRYRDGKIDDIGYEVVRGRGKTFKFRCTNDECYYEEELPVQVIDECLYKNPPTLLFSTVDKFAMLTWKGEASSFFAKDTESDTPELIIQDELHLIAGPLGTLVAQFETAIDYLCSMKGVKPKIISSTATICEANSQVYDLYNRDTLQFPPPGVKIEDSYFTKEEDASIKPGRLYVGVSGVGQTQITTEIRLFASIMQRVHKLDLSNDIKDKYWTLVSYFNSIRELGKALTLVDDDVKDYMIRMVLRNGGFKETRKVYSANELTSRVSSSQIVKTLGDLEIKYPDSNCINMLVATNMISVGVDVDRLNIMTVIGQPKLTSEYIQASSRVGRKDPGIVFTLYDGRKSRDESHYEIFQAYHQAFYKYVEPTSITPFSEPALERMLHSVFISIIRHSTNLNSEESAQFFDRNDFSIEKIKQYIVDRIDKDYISDRKIVEEKLEQIISRWEEKIEILDKPVKYTKGKNPLINDFYEDVDGIAGFETMKSMRNIDGEVKLKILYNEED